MIEKIRYRLVYNRKKKLNKQGMALVQIEANLNKRKIYITSQLYLRPEWWDSERAQVVNHQQENELNAMLYEKILELQATEISFWRRGLSPSLLDIKSAFKLHATADVTFLQFACRCVDQSSRRAGTKQNMYATLRRIRDFRGDVEIRDINYRYLTEFETYLHGCGLKLNSVGKHLRNIRTLINEAINQNYLSLSDYPFRQFKIKREKPEHRVLSAAELVRLERYQPKMGRQKLLGHTSVKTTQIYSEVLDKTLISDLKKAAKNA